MTALAALVGVLTLVAVVAVIVHRTAAAPRQLRRLTTQLRREQAFVDELCQQARRDQDVEPYAYTVIERIRAHQQAREITR